MVEGGCFEKLDSALYIWFCQERERGSPITGQILLENASGLHRLIYGEYSRSFLASTGLPLYLRNLEFDNVGKKNLEFKNF